MKKQNSELGNQVFIIKTRKIDSIEEDFLCGYINEDDAKKHIESYNNIYANDFKSVIWYEPLVIKNSFNLNL